MARNFGFFVGVGLLCVLVSILPIVPRMIIESSGMSKAYIITSSILFQIISYGISFVIGIGIIKISLSFCDEHKPPVGTLFNANGCFWRYAGVMILYGLIILAGYLLLIVPGIIWAVKFCNCKYFVVDKGMGPIDALKACAKTTQGVKWEIFGLFIVLMAINMAGAMCLYFGIFATYPITIIAQALVYRQLLAQTPELDHLRIAEPIENIEPREWA